MASFVVTTQLTLKPRAAILAMQRLPDSRNLVWRCALYSSFHFTPMQENP